MVLQIVIGIFLISTLVPINYSFAQEHQCDGKSATIVGTEKKDKLVGTSGDDVIVGLEGNDKIYGRGGNDIICGGDGKDVIFGNSGNDILIGEANSDNLIGGTGIDTCDSLSEDRLVISCEVQYINIISTISDVNPINNEDLQKQINDIMNEIKSAFVQWSNIKDIPEDLADGDNDTLTELECKSNQILLFNGEKWECVDNQVQEISDEGEPLSDDDTLRELNCNIYEIAKWDGTNWVCSKNESTSQSPIFFKYSGMAAGAMWVGTSESTSNDLDNDRPALIMPQSGIISNLHVSLGKSGDFQVPGQNENYTMTLYKNDIQETLLKCVIIDLENSCNDTTNQVSVSAGDSIVLKIEASDFVAFEIVRSSVLFSRL